VNRTPLVVASRPTAAPTGPAEELDRGTHRYVRSLSGTGSRIKSMCPRSAEEKCMVYKRRSSSCEWS
jgi:hypothetical protein